MLRRHNEKSVGYHDCTWDQGWGFGIDPEKEKSDPNHRFKVFFGSHIIARNGAMVHSLPVAAAWLLKYSVAKEGVTQPELEAALKAEHDRI